MRTLLASRAQSTITVYSHAFREFQAFAKRNHFSSLPSEPFHVVLFLEHKKLSGVGPSTLAQSLQGIAWWHKFMNYPNPADASICKLFLDGARRLAPPPVCRTIPATRNMLVQLQTVALQSGRVVEYRTFFMALLSYAGCLRFAETVALRFADISERDYGLDLFLLSSKTDQHKHGHTVHVASSTTSLSPSACYRTFLSKLPPDYVCPSAFLFANYQTKKPVSRDCSVRLVRSMLRSQNCAEADRVTMHSFRIGCATTLVETGLDSVNVRAHGRWRTNTSFDRYVRPSIQHRLEASRALAL